MRLLNPLDDQIRDLVDRSIKTAAGNAGTLDAKGAIGIFEKAPEATARQAPVRFNVKYQLDHPLLFYFQKPHAANVGPRDNGRGNVGRKEAIRPNLKRVPAIQKLDDTDHTTKTEEKYRNDADEQTERTGSFLDVSRITDPDADKDESNRPENKQQHLRRRSPDFYRFVQRQYPRSSCKFSPPH